MKLKPGCEEEYKKRHDEIWPELKKTLKEAGIYDYSIYLDRETGSLFAIQKISADNTTEGLADLPVMKKWWEYMHDIMETNPDHSPVETPLEQMFHMK
ncbi:MAG: L-rhamnose mutarotase [Balneolaceae bacterium]